VLIIFPLCGLINHRITNTKTTNERQNAVRAGKVRSNGLKKPIRLKPFSLFL
jgi:hypothetical protein